MQTFFTPQEVKQECPTGETGNLLFLISHGMPYFHNILAFSCPNVTKLVQKCPHCKTSFLGHLLAKGNESGQPLSLPKCFDTGPRELLPGRARILDVGYVMQYFTHQPRPGLRSMPVDVIFLIFKKEYEETSKSKFIAIHRRSSPFIATSLFLSQAYETISISCRGKF